MFQQQVWLRDLSLVLVPQSWVSIKFPINPVKNQIRRSLQGCWVIGSGSLPLWCDDPLSTGHVVECCLLWTSILLSSARQERRSPSFPPQKLHLPEICHRRRPGNGAPILSVPGYGRPFAERTTPISPSPLPHHGVTTENRRSQPNPTTPVPPPAPTDACSGSSPLDARGPASGGAAYRRGSRRNAGPTARNSVK